MPKSKSHSLQKHALNLRSGDFEKMGELFPELGSTVAIRKLIAAFIEKNYRTTTTLPELDKELDI